MKFFAVTFFGLAAAFSESLSYLPDSYYTEDGSMMFWKFPSDSSRIEYYLESMPSLQPGQSVYEMWYWANNAKVRDGTDEANYPRLEALMHGISDLKLHANTINGWENFVSCDGPNCCVGPDCVTTEITGPSSEESSEESFEEWSEEESSEEWSEDSEMETIMKQMCTSINYSILSDANPIDYPPMIGYDDVFQDGANCNLGGMVVYGCDCSDAENYSFADQDMCETFDSTHEELPQGLQQGVDALKSLVCEVIGEEWSQEWPEEWSEGEWSEGEEMDEEKNCRYINYAILSAANPTNYPAIETGLGDANNFVQVGPNCNTGVALALNCDCSDAADYSFADQDLCDELKLETENELFVVFAPQSIQQGMDKLKSLVCGYDVVDDISVDVSDDVSDDVSECIDAQKSLKAEENFFQKGLLRVECETACAEFPNEKCGFFINSVSLILFGMLAMLKY